MDRASDKQRATMEDLVPLVYDELRRVARRYFRNLAPGFTLQPTEMVDEACLHLIQHSRGEWESAEHFRVIASKKIWQVIVDHLRKRRARKRGGARRQLPTWGDHCDGELAPAQDRAEQCREWRRVPLDSVVVEWHDRLVDLLDLAEALDALAVESRRLSDVVTLHWFGGLTHVAVARSLGVSASTAEKDFRYALAWLNRKLVGNAGHVA